jgi:hypothetical protein
MSENVGNDTTGDLRKYVVFVVEDEPAWEAKSDAERQVTYDADYAFGQALEKRGGKVVGGSALAHTSRWQILEHNGGVTRRTDGPFTESVEQLGGFYIVESPSMEAVVEAAEEMMPVHVRLEIAPALNE